MDLFAYLLGKKAGLKNATKVVANPELVGGEDNLTSLQVGDEKYKVSEVNANPELAGTEAELEGIEIDGTKYKIVTKEHYSTDEKVIGTWTNGKPLYRKVFSGTKISGTHSKCLIPDLKDIINAYGNITADDNGTLYIYPISYYESNSTYVRLQYKSDGLLILSSTGIFINGDFVAVVEYTKTTD